MSVLHYDRSSSNIVILYTKTDNNFYRYRIYEFWNNGRKQHEPPLSCPRRVNTNPPFNAFFWAFLHEIRRESIEVAELANR
jgi:hypothetical protein